MKWTLLQLTQNILSALSSDEVNSIGDTVESQQVAEIVRTTYFNIISRSELPEHHRLFQLDSSLDVTRPTLMSLPAIGKSIDWIRYYNTDSSTSVTSSKTFIHDLNVDIRNVGVSTGSGPNYVTVNLLPMDQFLSMTNQFSVVGDTTVGSYIQNGIHFNYKNNRHPTWATVLQDKSVIFDSYNTLVETTLQSSKTLCFGYVVPDFKMQDSFIPDLDDPQFPLLLNEAKSLAFVELKQIVHNKAEQESKRQWGNLQQTKAVLNKPTYFDQLPDFGRRSNVRLRSI